MRILLRIAKGLLLLVGLVVLLHLVCLLCQRPLVRLVEVEGDSMQPTFEPGDRLLFIRWRFEPGTIVIADAGDEGLLVKRVASVTDGRVLLVGDNSEHSAAFNLRRSEVVGVYVGRFSLKFPCCQAR